MRLIARSRGNPSCIVSLPFGSLCMNIGRFEENMLSVGEVVLMKEWAVLAIVAGFPYIIERIPCCFVIYKRINVEHLTNPIIGTIYIGICIIHESNHLSHNVIPSCLHFRREWKHRSDFVHDGIFARIREHYKRLCDTLTNCPPGGSDSQ